MSSTAASLATPAPKKAGLAKCSPERHQATLAFAPWFTAWCDENRISVRDLSAILHCSHGVAVKKRLGESPLTAIDVSLFNRRDRHVLMSMFLTWCDAREALAAAG